MPAPKGNAKGRETRRQKDDFAAQNIPPGTKVLYDKVKGSLKGKTPHAKAEAFDRDQTKILIIENDQAASSPSGASSSMSDYPQDLSIPF